MSMQMSHGKRLALLAALSLCAIAPAQEQKKFGKIFSRPIDGLINGLAAAGQASGARGSGSCRDTARVLAAMANSHRFYTLADGPSVRRPVLFLFKNRRNNGSFANKADDNPVATTHWVVDALIALDPEEHATEIEMAQAWLKRQKDSEVSPWHALVRQIKRQVTEQGQTPPEIGEKTAARAMGRLAPKESVDALLELVACQVVARQMDAGTRGIVPKQFLAAQQKGINWLMTRQKDGVFFVDSSHGRFKDPGLTGLAIAALMSKPQAQWSPDEKAVVEKGLAYLITQQNKDGSFGKQVVNYTTCAAIMALAKSGRPEYDPNLKLAQHYILGIQNIEDRGYAASDRDYGSIGYGGDQRGDLSNLQFAIEALRATELDENHEAFAKAMVFLQRTQNLKSVNDYKAKTKDSQGNWIKVRGSNDGGAAYYPGNSPAGFDVASDGSKLPRSYGSMTYALLKTYIFCGLKKDDHRIVAAVDWVQDHWTLVENPGSSPLLGEKAKFQGLFYYYMVMAQALDTAGVDKLSVGTVESTERRAVDWRKELKYCLQDIQNENGSWRNEKNGRWWEVQAAICTVYALLALERCN